MQSDDFYSSPQSRLETDANTREDVKAFSFRGRIGRTYYIVFTLGFTLLMYFGMTALLMLAVNVAMNSSNTRLSGFFAISTRFITLIFLLPIFIMTIIWTVRRCRDFNVTGWLAVVLVVPLTPLLFWFIPGTKGPNRFGRQPVSGPRWGLLLILIPVIAGIVAAIAIPAYQSYVDRATLGAATPLSYKPV